MEKHTIAKSDVTASRIGLGTWSMGGFLWGGQLNEETAIETVFAALKRGVTFIDTAPVYGLGAVEEVVGKALAMWGTRDDVQIATKCGLEFNRKGNVVRNCTKDRLYKEVDESLRRLRTDYIDLYQVHWPDPRVPFEETAEVLMDILQSGKIHAIGVCNFSVEQMERAQLLLPLSTCQSPYNLFERQVEADILPFCQRNGISFIAYGALCRGLLTGKVKADSVYPGDDIRRMDPKFRAPHLAKYLEAYKRLDAYAQKAFDKSGMLMAVRWLMDQPGVGFALWGAREATQIRPVTQLLDFEMEMEPEAVEEINRILRETVPQAIGTEFMAPPARP